MIELTFACTYLKRWNGGCNNYCLASHDRTLRTIDGICTRISLSLKRTLKGSQAISVTLLNNITNFGRSAALSSLFSTSPYERVKLVLECRRRSPMLYIYAASGIFK